MATINIKYPISESSKGDWVEMTETKQQAIKSNLLFFLTTQKGSRYYKPDFGTNLQRFLFEPFTEKTKTDVENDIISSVLRSFPNIKIDNMEFATQLDHILSITIYFSYTEDVFKYSDSITIQNL